MGDFAFAVAAQQIDVTGFLAGGGIVSTTLYLDLLADGQGGVDDFQTFVFGSEWTYLESVEFVATGPANIYGTRFAVDNLVLNVVPIPAAVYLFGSALLGLSWMRRKA